MLSVSGSYRRAKLERNCLTNHQHCSFQGERKNFFRYNKISFVIIKKKNKKNNSFQGAIYLHLQAQALRFSLGVGDTPTPTYTFSFNPNLFSSQIISSRPSSFSMREQRVSHFFAASSSGSDHPEKQSCTLSHRWPVRM